MCNAQKGGDRAGGDQVVPARVPDVRERIVLGIEDHKASAGAILRLEGCGNAMGMRSDGKPQAPQKGNDVVMSLHFFEPEFWVLVDLYG